MRHRLDLERELDDRDPPGKVGRVTFDDTSHKQIKASARAKPSAAAVAEADAVATAGGIKWSTKEAPVGRALVSSHHLRSQVCYSFPLLLYSVFKSAHSSINLPNRHNMLPDTACVCVCVYIYIYIYI